MYVAFRQNLLYLRALPSITIVHRKGPHGNDLRVNFCVVSRSYEYSATQVRLTTCAGPRITITSRCDPILMLMATAPSLPRRSPRPICGPDGKGPSRTGSRVGDLSPRHLRAVCRAPYPSRSRAPGKGAMPSGSQTGREILTTGSIAGHATGCIQCSQGCHNGNAL